MRDIFPIAIERASSKVAFFSAVFLFSTALTSFSSSLVSFQCGVKPQVTGGQDPGGSVIQVFGRQPRQTISTSCRCRGTTPSTVSASFESVAFECAASTELYASEKSASRPKDAPPLNTISSSQVLSLSRYFALVLRRSRHLLHAVDACRRPGAATITDRSTGAYSWRIYR
jgi:hypothetical protein